LTTNRSIYLAPTGAGNRAGLLEHVDWRGRGGYVVAPPSRHVSGARYRWLRPLTADLPATPWPQRTLLLPARQQRRPDAVPWFREESAGHPCGRAALKEELAAVAQAPQGRRNHTLYQAGIRRPAGRRRRQPAAGRGADPDPPHPGLGRAHWACPPPRHPRQRPGATPRSDASLAGSTNQTS
jgi:Bifunctional DNA primase/polymerase, N-terminal